VRVLSRNGDILDAPSASLTAAGAVVDIDPSIDPVPIPRDRLLGIIWPGAPGPPAPGAGERGTVLVDLRSGERLAGKLVSLDERRLVLVGSGTQISLERREVRAIWFGERRVKPIDDCARPSLLDAGRPSHRIGRNAVGGPLAIGGRTYRRGLGLRGAGSMVVEVPSGAHWLLVDLGADSSAAPFARIDLEILVEGGGSVRRVGLAPGDPAETAAVLVKGARALTVRIGPSGSDDPTGSLGDLADAIFID
jgi:hypothetical protein